MKIKKFKNIVSAEKIDIPDIFEKIKPIAYAKKVPALATIKPSYRKRIIFASLVTVTCAFLLIFFVPGGLKEVIDFDPMNTESSLDDPTLDPNVPKDSENESEDPEVPTDNPRTYQQDYYYSLFNSIGSEVEPSDSEGVVLTEEQKETVLPPSVFYAMYDIIITSGITDYDMVINDLIAWGKDYSYDATYFHDNNDKILYVYDLLIG
ncbi:MAG: hypothetical protein PHO86_00400 [Bacilli bacterium]|nr:hypothetical protein [Bacilli bacterium]